MNIDKLVGLIGWPVSHSVSPAMHNAAYRELGLANWFYVPMPVSTTSVKDAVMGLRALGFLGANVTVPHKEAVVPFLDELGDSARAIGAVNTIVVEEDGRMIGHNTDADGFIADLKERGIVVHDRHAVVLGAGGSARAIVYALLKHDCKKLTILNRTKAKADELAYSFGRMFLKAHIDTDVLEKKIDSCDLVINTTSLGMAATKGSSPWRDDLSFTREQVIYDLIYNPKQTLLLQKATHDGACALNGLGMLVQQGALAFEMWTKRKAPAALMRAAAEEALFS